MKRFLTLVFYLGFVFIVYEILFVLPSPFYEGREVSPKKFELKEIVINILKDKKNDFQCRKEYTGYLRKNPYNGGCLLTLGKYMWATETREILPLKKEYSFSYRVKGDEVLKFSIGVGKNGFKGEILINTEPVFSKNVSPPEQNLTFIFNKFLKHLHFNFKPIGGYWKDFLIDLKKYRGEKIRIKIKKEKGFYGNFYILKKREKKRLNIILIQVDSLRRDIVGKGVMKTVDFLAKNGFFLKNAFSNANWTRPSNLSQFYSKLSNELGISDTKFHIFPLEKELFYRRKLKNLITILRKNGYITGFIGNNIFLHGFSSLGVDIGFESYLDFENQKYETEYILEFAEKWIKNTNGAPFFLFLDFNKSHTPYKPKINDIDLKELFINRRFALYKATLRNIDRKIKKLLSFLEKSGLLENTLIIVNGDHGEVFKNYGKPFITPERKASKIWNHGSTLKCEELKVPVIFYLKNKIKGESNISFQLLDIAPTILGFIGIDEKIFRGRNLKEHILKGKAEKEIPIFLESKGEKGVIYKGYEFILKGNKGKNELYNLKKEPYCKNSTSNYKIEKYLKTLVKTFPSPPPVLFIEYKNSCGEIHLKFKEKPYYIFKEGALNFKGETLSFCGKKGKILIFTKNMPLRIQIVKGKGFITPAGVLSSFKIFEGKRLNFLRAEYPPIPVNNGFTLSLLNYNTAKKILIEKGNKTNIIDASKILKEWGYKK